MPKISSGAFVGLLAASLFWFAFVILIMAWPTLILVNYLFTPSLLLSVFGVAKIGFWQAFCLNALGGLLFKGGSVSNSKSQ
jgi:hypothetical protein